MGVQATRRIASRGSRGDVMKYRMIQSRVYAVLVAGVWLIGIWAGRMAARPLSWEESDRSPALAPGDAPRPTPSAVRPPQRLGRPLIPNTRSSSLAPWIPVPRKSLKTKVVLCDFLS